MIVRQHWVCFACRKQFRKSPEFARSLAWREERQKTHIGLQESPVEYACPECNAPLTNMGKYFKPPRREDRKAWENMRLLAEHGIRFATQGSVVYLGLANGPRPTRRTIDRIIASCPCHTRSEGQRLLLKIANKKQRWIMPKRPVPNFSQIVCSEAGVRSAFVGYSPMRVWWRIVLWLHGKPIDAELSPEERIRRVAEGFQFYAGLYRLLAVILLLLVPLLLYIIGIDTGNPMFYGMVASLMAGSYLWAVTGLGYAGATEYARGEQAGRTSLVAFMVMIVAFLSLFLSAISVICQTEKWMPALPNLLLIASLFVVGVGSYMIEIIYLVDNGT